MGHAYTPGLRVSEHTVVRKERRLPIAGKVLVECGAAVKARDIVARAELPGDVATVNVVNRLGIAAAELPRFMLKNVGEAVAAAEPIAENRPWIKRFRTVVKSPVEGTIESVSQITGQVLVRTAPRRVELAAYIDGEVVEVFENEGVMVQAAGAFVQGIFGVGGETHGELVVVGNGPAAVLNPGDLHQGLADKIVVAGSLLTSAIYKRAAEIGIAALICGGIHDSDLRELLGYDLGVAITGHEKIKPILIVTEGFGPMTIAKATYQLLESRAGQAASANGATQIRAGVLRPEIIIPSSLAAARGEGKAEQAVLGLHPGSPVRIIREPGFGRLGAIKSLPEGLVRIETEAKVRVAEVEFQDGSVAVVPRANVEAIES